MKARKSLCGKGASYAKRRDRDARTRRIVVAAKRTDLVRLLSPAGCSVPQCAAAASWPSSSAMQTRARRTTPCGSVRRLAPRACCRCCRRPLSCPRSLSPCRLLPIPPFALFLPAGSVQSCDSLFDPAALSYAASGRSQRRARIA